MRTADRCGNARQGRFRALRSLGCGDRARNGGHRDEILPRLASAAQRAVGCSRQELVREEEVGRW